MAWYYCVNVKFNPLSQNEIPYLIYTKFDKVEYIHMLLKRTKFCWDVIAWRYIFLSFLLFLNIIFLCKLPHPMEDLDVKLLNAVWPSECSSSEQIKTDKNWLDPDEAKSYSTYLQLLSKLLKRLIASSFLTMLLLLQQSCCQTGSCTFNWNGDATDIVH